MITKDLMKLHADYSELLKHPQSSELAHFPLPNGDPRPAAFVSPPPPPAVPQSQPQQAYPFAFDGRSAQIQAPVQQPQPTTQPRPVPFPTCVRVLNGDVIGCLISISPEEWEGLITSNRGQMVEFGNLVWTALWQIVSSGKKFKEDIVERILYSSDIDQCVARDKMRIMNFKELFAANDPLVRAVYDLVGQMHAIVFDPGNKALTKMLRQNIEQAIMSRPAPNPFIT